MNNENDKKTVHDKVLETIKSGRVSMQPRWHFVLRAVLYATGGFMLLLLLVYLASFVVFGLQETGAWFAPLFGSRGWFALLTSIPWMLVAIAIVFVAALEILIRRYSFSYRRPLAYSLVGIIAVTCIGSTLLIQARIHRQLFDYARRGQLPVVGDLYLRFGLEPHRNIIRGIVTALTSSSLEVRDVRGATSSIVVSPATQMIPPDARIGIGDAVMIFDDHDSDRDDQVITALGIRKEVIGE